MTSPSALLTTEMAPVVLAASATLSVAYSYRFTLARYGLLGYSYVKDALASRALVMPVLNAEAQSVVADGVNTNVDALIRVFPHVEHINCLYASDTRLSAQDEEALCTAIRQWRAVPLDNVCQHLCLYDALLMACARVPIWRKKTLPKTIVITYDTLLMELTHIRPLVEPTEKNMETVVCLERGVSNALKWPSQRCTTPPLPNKMTVTKEEEEEEEEQSK